MLNTPGSNNVETQNDIGLLIDDWVQAVGSRLDQMVSREDLDFERD